MSRAGQSELIYACMGHLGGKMDKLAFDDFQILEIKYFQILAMVLNVLNGVEKKNLLVLQYTSYKILITNLYAVWRNVDFELS